MDFDYSLRPGLEGLYRSQFTGTARSFLESILILAVRCLLTTATTAWVQSLA